MSFKMKGEEDDDNERATIKIMQQKLICYTVSAGMAINIPSHLSLIAHRHTPRANEEIMYDSAIYGPDIITAN